MTSNAIWVDEITGAIKSIKKVNKNLNILKKYFFKKILHNFSFLVNMYIYINIEWSIPLSD